MILKICEVVKLQNDKPQKQCSTKAYISVTMHIAFKDICRTFVLYRKSNFFQQMFVLQCHHVVSVACFFKKMFLS